MYRGGGGVERKGSTLMMHKKVVPPPLEYLKEEGTEEEEARLPGNALKEESEFLARLHFPEKQLFSDPS